MKRHYTKKFPRRIQHIYSLTHISYDIKITKKTNDLFYRNCKGITETPSNASD